MENQNNIKQIHQKANKKGFNFFAGYMLVSVVAIIFGFIFLSFSDDKAVMLGAFFSGGGLLSIIVCILTFVIQKMPATKVEGKVLEKQANNGYLVELNNGENVVFVASAGIYLLAGDKGQFFVKGKLISEFIGERRQSQ